MQKQSKMDAQVQMVSEEGQDINVEDGHQDLGGSHQETIENNELVIRQINSADNTFEYSKERGDYKHKDEN